MTTPAVIPEISVPPSPYQVPQAFSLVIFGASGDLTRRKLFPALYALAHDNLLPERFAVIGFARREKSHEAFREEIRVAVDEFSRFRPVQPEVWERLAKGIYYVPSAFEDPAGYAALGKQLAEVEARYGTCGNRMYYLATPATSYTTVVGQLGAAGLVSAPWPELSGTDWPCWSRVIIEKPFGRDLATAVALNAEIHKTFHETQIYRIDHYLGKETVQNILAFRFGNSVFEPLWNRRYVDHVQLLVAEYIGVEGRGGYYDAAGALRDMVQNHMLQLLSLVAMEPPATFDAEAVRDEKVKVLRAIRPPAAARVGEVTVRGQYVRGSLKGTRVPAYADEPRVAEDTTTETYAAVRLEVDNWRWAGVPFYLRTGKALPKHLLPPDREGAPEVGDRGDDPVPAPPVAAVRARAAPGASTGR